MKLENKYTSNEENINKTDDNVVIFKENEEDAAFVEGNIKCEAEIESSIKRRRFDTKYVIKTLINAGRWQRRRRQ